MNKILHVFDGLWEAIYARYVLMVITNISGEKIIYPNMQIQPMDYYRRFKSVAITFLKAGGFTLLTAFIPVLHFILVPIGVLVTLSSTILAWKKAYDLENFEVHCPSCDKKSVTRVAGSTLPLRTFCSHCRNMVYLNN